jgi:hypothetical protein
VCRKRGLDCGGYNEPLRPTLPVAKRSAPMTRSVSLDIPAQAVALFLQALETQTSGAVSRWYIDLPSCLGHSPMFDNAAAAYAMVYMGTKHGRSGWVEEGRGFYAKACRSVRTMRPTESYLEIEQVIRTAMVMGFYEVRLYSCVARIIHTTNMCSS